MDCVNGFEKEVVYKIMVYCNSCSGLGFDSKLSLSTCTNCKGSGRIVRQKLGMVIQLTCSRCSGTGKQMPPSCTSCRGRGSVENKKITKIKIPKGIEAGQKVRLSAAGHKIYDDAIPGDVYVEIVSPRIYKNFKRKGLDIYSNLNVSFPDAVLGAKLDVPTIFGKSILSIPKGCKPGTVLKMSEAGVKIESGKKGNQFVKIDIEIPTEIDKNQKDAIENLRKIL